MILREYSFFNYLGCLSLKLTTFILKDSEFKTCLYLCSYFTNNLQNLEVITSI